VVAAVILIKKINRVNRAFANFSKQRAAVVNSIRELDWQILRPPKNKAPTSGGTDGADEIHQNFFNNGAQSSTKEGAQ
jgi:hypothetical protein